MLSWGLTADKPLHLPTCEGRTIGTNEQKQDGMNSSFNSHGHKVFGVIPRVVAIVSDRPEDETYTSGVAVFAMDQIALIADFVINIMTLDRAGK